MVLFIPLLLTGCKIFSTDETQHYNKLKVKEKYQLNYNLAFGSERYQFIVDVLEVEPYRKFKYTMTNSRQSSRTVTIRPNALDTARVLVNEFSWWIDTFNNNTSTVWFSRRMFEELVTNDTTYFDPNKSRYRYYSTFYNAGKVPFEYELNGVPQVIEAIKVVEVYQGKKQRSFLVLNDKKYPLILMMDVGWVISLKEINHNYD